MTLLSGAAAWPLAARAQQPERMRQIGVLTGSSRGDAQAIRGERRQCTNSPLERIMREIRRRTRVVGAFPDGQSCLNLAAARLRYIAGTAWSTKCYMNMRPLYQPQLMQTEAFA